MATHSISKITVPQCLLRLFDSKAKHGISRLRAYNRAKYLTERIKLMRDWADLRDIFREQSAKPRRVA
jgi:hypothetical protein